MYWLLITILCLDGLLLTTAILLQAGQGGGLASLGGGAGTEQFMGGRQATTLLHKITWWAGGIFLFLSLVLALMSARTATPRSVIDATAPQPAPVQPAPLPLQSTPRDTPAAQNPPPSGERPPER